MAWVRVRDALRRREHDFAELVSLELKCKRLRSSKGHDAYRCDVIAQLRDAEARDRMVRVLSTRSFSEDPDTPYRMALPLVTELARALGVKRVVTDYP